MLACPCAAVFSLVKVQAESLEVNSLTIAEPFLIVSFRRKEETYVLDASIVLDLYKNGDRKSIPYSVFKEKGHLVKEGYALRLDYLSIIDKHFI